MTDSLEKRYEKAREKVAGKKNPKAADLKAYKALAAEFAASRTRVRSGGRSAGPGAPAPKSVAATAELKKE